MAYQNIFFIVIMFFLSFSAAAEYEILITVDDDYTYNSVENNSEVSQNSKSGNGSVDSYESNNSDTTSPTSPNKDPIANNDSELVTSEGETLESINVLDNDSDPDGDEIKVESASARNGSATINPDGTIKYKPYSDFIGSDKIVYKITDGKGGSAVAEFSVSVEYKISEAKPGNSNSDRPEGGDSSSLPSNLPVVQDKDADLKSRTEEIIKSQSKEYGCDWVYNEYIIEKRIPRSYPATHNWNDWSKFDIKEYEKLILGCK